MIRMAIQVVFIDDAGGRREVHEIVGIDRDVQTVDEKPRARLVDTLRRQGMQPHQQIVFLSDGAETLRRLQQDIAPEAEHVLDWFHVTMRLTILRQMIKGAWADAATVETKAAALRQLPQKWQRNAGGSGGGTKNSEEQAHTSHRGGAHSKTAPSISRPARSNPGRRPLKS
jgi:hypothetical protein